MPQDVESYVYSETANVSKDDIGDIEIYDKFAFIDAKEKVSKSILKNSSGRSFGGRKIKIEVSKPKN
ncbi:DbpA RNA binding domain-containing protein [Thermoanaerobacterium sp. RBIITD]|uniref:DbpA RNA binding domain-containing protein n=1 Tax=Thermoanaerobacterium sp. RBIITD TaxID=1550240 RepID=UPI000BB705E6|nr:DbpA RNA binding domain-containing protein [Thermoanaerobacterium sp. RBIITD]